jgi:dTMP kinase
VAAERIAAEGRAADRFEGEGMELQKKVAEGYEAMAARHPERIRVIDASSDRDSVHAAVMAEVAGVRA